MKEFFKPATTDKIINRASVISGVLILLALLYAAFNFFKLPPFVPVFNQLPWGNDRIASKGFIFAPAAITILILAANLTLSSYVYEKSPLISRIFSITSLLSAFLILIFTIVIISLVI